MVKSLDKVQQLRNRNRRFQNRSKIIQKCIKCLKSQEDLQITRTQNFKTIKKLERVHRSLFTGENNKIIQSIEFDAISLSLKSKLGLFRTIKITKQLGSLMKKLRRAPRIPKISEINVSLESTQKVQERPSVIVFAKPPQLNGKLIGFSICILLISFATVFNLKVS